MSKIGIQMKDKTGNEIYPNPFPVGAVYISVDSRNPGSIFGGTWVQIKDRFLLAAGDTYRNGNTGGVSSVTLNTSQMPAHSHSAGLNNGGGHQHVMWFGGGANSGSGGQIPVANSRWGQDTAGMTDGSHDHGGIWMANAGGNQAHENMPPYLVVYIWRRVS